MVEALARMALRRELSLDLANLLVIQLRVGSCEGHAVILLPERCLANEHVVLTAHVSLAALRREVQALPEHPLGRSEDLTEAAGGNGLNPIVPASEEDRLLGTSICKPHLPQIVTSQEPDARCADVTAIARSVPAPQELSYILEPPIIGLELYALDVDARGLCRPLDALVKVPLVDPAQCAREGQPHVQVVASSAQDFHHLPIQGTVWLVILCITWVNSERGRRVIL
mmetsp:Transcript_13631/g.37868  ORF Transcript_13631/g.37868 Transcript_13631/m.37868 type:complete len:227 (+) Transcript_13631:234-914(+)